MSNHIKIKKRKNCPLCNAENSEISVLVYENWELAECSQCSFVYMPVVPVYEMMKEEFAWEKNFIPSKDIKLSKKIRRYIKGLIKRNKLLFLLDKYIKEGQVLDIGCGSGIKFNDLPQKFIPFGIDISEKSAFEAKTNFEKRGGTAICAPATDVLKEYGKNKFKGAILRSYLEHEHHPFEVLDELKETLTHDGGIIIKVPNYASVNRIVRGKNWCGYRFPDHVNQFTPDTLEKMVIKAGYKIIKFNYLDKQITSDNMWMVAKPI
ncbi:MAG: class I SAM-dependent methyltransferase [Alphaproteobacteria bacterium]